MAPLREGKGLKEKVDTWMPLYVGSLVADTLHLTAELFGAYILLIVHYWRKGAPVDDDATLATITRLNGSWLKHRPMLEEFFEVVDGKWWHGRIEEELKKAKGFKEEKSRAGKAGAAARWQSDGEGDGRRIAEGMAEAMANPMAKNGPSPTPTPSPSKPPEPAPEEARAENGASSPFVLEEPVLLKAKNPISLKGFFALCEKAHQPPVPEGDPVFAYSEKAKIPTEFLHLCWQEFRARHIDTATKKKDWRAHFRNCVRDNWYKLWAVDRDGGYFLTTAGKQAQKANAK